MDILRATGLTRSFGKRRVVAGVDVHVGAGEIVGLLGPNGAGKTTTFRMILGLLRPDAGRVMLGDRDISHLPVYKRARLGIGYLAQEPSIFRSLSVEENLRIVMEWIPGLGRSEAEERTEGLLERLHLTALASQKAGQLSGGEQRRLEFARVLARNPRLILLDEPFANVDPITVEEIQGILESLRSEGMGILLTDHSVRETLSITDRACIIVDGQVIRHGPARELVNDPLVRKTYLGERFTMPELSSTAQGGPPLTGSAPPPDDRVETPPEKRRT